LTTMKIIAAPHLCSELSLRPLAFVDPCEQRQDTCCPCHRHGPYDGSDMPRQCSFCSLLATQEIRLDIFIDI
jgi:hypothetical protein